MLPHWKLPDRKRLDPLIAKLQSEGVHLLSLHTLMQRTGLSRDAVRTVAARLVQRGLLVRVGRGLYQLPGTTVPDLLSVQLRAHGAGDYRLSYRSALAVYGLGDPLPQEHLYLTTRNRRPARILSGGHHLHFIQRPRGFPLRQVEVELPGIGAVPVTDLETTVLDAVHRADLCGGIFAAVHLLAHRRQELKVPMLIADALKVRAPIRARLGMLLDIAGLVSDQQRDALRRERPASLPLLDVTQPPGGPKVKFWGLRMNVPFEELQRMLNPRGQAA